MVDVPPRLIPQGSQFGRIGAEEVGIKARELHAPFPNVSPHVVPRRAAEQGNAQGDRGNPKDQRTSGKTSLSASRYIRGRNGPREDARLPREVDRREKA